MGQAGSVACGNTVNKDYKHKFQSSTLGENENETAHHLTSQAHDHQSNPLYNNQHAHQLRSQSNINMNVHYHQHPHSKPVPKLKHHSFSVSDDITTDDTLIDKHNVNTLILSPNAQTSNTSKRRIKYRERKESKPMIDSNNISFIQYNNEQNTPNTMGLTHAQYAKYKKYKRMRSKYIRMEQLIENLLSLNPKNLEHILMLRKTDNIDMNEFYQYITSQTNGVSLHLPQLKRINESLSFYAVSFHPIGASRKLWHILLQDRRHKLIIKENEVRLWIAQLLAAVSFLHKHNIVHLDISPQSILMCDNRLILTGFDTSMLVNDHITYNVSCELLNCCWQLPPTIRRRSDFNGFELKSFDAWSIGVLTFLLLTAKFPFFKDKHNKRIPEAQYVRNEETISHSARDFISKLLCSSITNRLNVHNALHHPWIAGKKNIKQRIRLDGSIYSSMYMHHEQKLNLKYHILAQETRKYFTADHNKLRHKLKKVNKKLIKYQEEIDAVHATTKRTSHAKKQASAKYIEYSHSDYSSSCSSHNASSDESDISQMDAIESVIKKPQKQCTTIKKKRKRTKSDSLRNKTQKTNKDKRRNRANSQHTYSEYRAMHPVNTIDVEKWKESKTLDKGLSPLMDMSQTQEIHDTKPGLLINRDHHNTYVSPPAQVRHPHFIRSNHQLTPTKRMSINSNHIPIYSQQTNVTTPNPTSDSTQNGVRLSPNQLHHFQYRTKHKTSLGNLIAIERSHEPKEHIQNTQHLATIHDIDMLTADDINCHKKKNKTPRKPLLPPKIIKLDSPSHTNVSSPSSSVERRSDHKEAPRAFAITRREISLNNNQTPKVIPLFSDSVTENKERSSRKQVDFISEHAINEYDPLDLNDSAQHKAAYRASQSPQAAAVAAVSGQTYAILSEENLSLHDLHLNSKKANKSGVNLMALGSNSNDSEHKLLLLKEASASGAGSGLLFDSILKQNRSNSKAVLEKASDDTSKKAHSAMDIVRAHKKHNNNASAKFVEYLAQPQDMDATPRSSVMSLENILQERGLFKKAAKDQIRQTRDVILAIDNNNNSNAFDPRLLENNPAIQMRKNHNINKLNVSKGRTHAISLANSVTPSVTEHVDDDEYKQHTNIHYKIQQQIHNAQEEEEESQSDIIHPATTIYATQSMPIITSPAIISNHNDHHLQYTHYSYASDNKSNNSHTSSKSQQRSSISALSVPQSPLQNSFVPQNSNSVNSRNRNSCNQYFRSSEASAEWSEDEEQYEDDENRPITNAMYDGRTSTY